MMKTCLLGAGLWTLITALGFGAAAAEEGGGSPAVIRPGGIGTVQRVQDEVVVIDDRSYTVSSSTQYRAADGEETWKESFRAGDRVLFETQSRREILLLRKLE